MVLDVKGAYLKSNIRKDIDEKLFVRLPNGVIVRLTKYLYGLKQAGYEWEKNITGCLVDLGYQQSATDPLVFSKWSGKECIIMCIHVDDFYVVSSTESMLKKLYGELTRKYGDVSIKDGDLLAYLGVKICIDSSSRIITLSQPVYAKKLVDTYLPEDNGQRSKRQYRTPMAVIEVNKPGDEVAFDQTKYLEMVGGLNYLSQYTRPDIMYAVSVCAQQCSKPTAGDVRRIMRLLKYIRDTVEVGLRFHPGEIKLSCYVDASYNAYKDGKGHYGYSFALGHRDGAFFAKSKKFSLTVLSSTEAEYVALCEATRESVWLRRLLCDIGFVQDGPSRVWQDNMSTIAMVNGHRQFQASKHINPKFHYTGEAVERKEIDIAHKSTDMMVADILTKALSASSHARVGNLLLG